MGGPIDIIKGVGVGHSWPWPWPFGAKVRCMDLPDSDRGDFSCRRAVHLVFKIYHFQNGAAADPLVARVSQYTQQELSDSS